MYFFSVYRKRVEIYVPIQKWYSAFPLISLNTHTHSPPITRHPLHPHTAITEEVRPDTTRHDDPSMSRRSVCLPRPRLESAGPVMLDRERRATAGDDPSDHGARSTHHGARSTEHGPIEPPRRCRRRRGLDPLTGGGGAGAGGGTLYS